MTKTATDYKKLSASELQNHINWLEKTNTGIWKFIAEENPGRRDYTMLKMMTSQHSQMIKRCINRLDQLRNTPTVGGKVVNKMQLI